MNDTCNAALAITFQIQTTAVHDLPTQKTAVKCCEGNLAVLKVFMQMTFSYDI